MLLYLISSQDSMKMDLSNIDEFDKLLLKTIDDVLRECLGETNARIVFNYLEKRSCAVLEIPLKLEVFSRELRMLLGSGSDQILGSGAILEETVVEVLCHKIGVKPSVRTPINFPDYVRKLKKVYCLAKKLQEVESEKTTSNPRLDVLRRNASRFQPTGGEKA
jgi:hypothetical protein